MKEGLSKGIKQACFTHLVSRLRFSGLVFVFFLNETLFKKFGFTIDCSNHHSRVVDLEPPDRAADPGDTQTTNDCFKCSHFDYCSTEKNCVCNINND